MRPKSDVGWNTINTNTGFVTAYYFSADDITTDSFNQMWSLPSDHIVHVLALRKQRGGPVTVTALVRTTEPSRPDQPPTLYLNPLPADEHAAALRAGPPASRGCSCPAECSTAPRICVSRSARPASWSARRYVTTLPPGRRFSATTW